MSPSTLRVRQVAPCRYFWPWKLTPEHCVCWLLLSKREKACANFSLIWTQPPKQNQRNWFPWMYKLCHCCANVGVSWYDMNQTYIKANIWCYWFLINDLSMNWWGVAITHTTKSSKKKKLLTKISLSSTSYVHKKEKERKDTTSTQNLWDRFQPSFSLLYSPLIFPPIIKNVSLGVVISSMKYSCNYHRVCMQPINPKAIN